MSITVSVRRPGRYRRRIFRDSFFGRRRRSPQAPSKAADNENLILIYFRRAADRTSLGKRDKWEAAAYRTKSPLPFPPPPPLKIWLISVAFLSSACFTSGLV